MTDERPEKEGLSAEELAELEGEVLPDREVMSVLDANVSIPLDPAIAADVLADEDPGAAGELEPANDEEDASTS
jgi:hypothetical protein